MKSHEEKSNHIIFNPEKNINKKDYTPTEIYRTFHSIKQYLGVMETEIIKEHKKEYHIIELINFLIMNENINDLQKVVTEFPECLNQSYLDIEKPIFIAMYSKNIDIFNLLKKAGTDFNILDFDSMNVYENCIYNDIFWPYVYDKLSKKELYEKITTTKSDIYEHACFESLFHNDERSIERLKSFKNKYPEILQKVIKNYSHNSKIKKATGETLLIIHNYDKLEEELNSILDNKNVKLKKKVLKF